MHHLRFIPSALICALIAMLTAVVMNPLIIKLAVKKHLTDNPNARKLQKRPVPVLGGMSVYLAFVMGLFCCNFFYPTDRLYVVVAALSVMFFLGFFDDLIDINYKWKFVVQFGVVFMLFHGAEVKFGDRQEEHHDDGEQRVEVEGNRLDEKSQPISVLHI